MIKGKWRIDLGGKIKGAKSVALGSAVTKRGQDNSLQMCERCKYQAGGGAAAQRARGAGPGGLGGPARAGGPLGVCPVRLAPLRRVYTQGEGNGVSGYPRFQAGVSSLGCRCAGQALPSKSHSRPLGTRGGGFKSLPRPSAPLCAPPRPSAPGLSRRSQARQPDPTLQRPRPGPPTAPSRPGSRPSPLPGRAGGGGGSLRSGSLWRRCVRRSLCRGARSRGNANEANPGRRAEEPEGDGREGARRGDGCLPRGREEGRGAARGAGCDPRGAALWARWAESGPQGAWLCGVGLGGRWGQWGPEWRTPSHPPQSPLPLPPLSLGS